jgi:signal transduction histidine kinase
VLPVAAVITALAIFVFDAVTPPDCVVSGLYVLVVMMAGRFCRGSRLLLVCAGCAGLTLLSELVSHLISPARAQEGYIGALDATVSIIAVGVSGYLVLRGQAAEATLMRAQTDLARISRITTMGELTASIAHEVNQPIAAVVTNAGACLRWLAADEPDLGKVRAAATRIMRDGARAADIIKRIRLVFGKGEATRASVDLNQLARETVGLLTAETARYGASVRMDLKVDLPSVTGDPVQLQQVMLNLLLNGLEAMKATTGPRELTVTSDLTGGGEAMFGIADTGIGLPPGEDERVFDPFFTTKPEGTGMGLSISRSIIEAHQGRLWARANAPKGSVFMFALQVAPDATGGPPKPKASLEHGYTKV